MVGLEIVVFGNTVEIVSYMYVRYEFFIYSLLKAGKQHYRNYTPAEYYGYSNKDQILACTKTTLLTCTKTKTKTRLLANTKTKLKLKVN